MTMQKNWKEIAGVLTTVVVLIGIPAALWYWQAVALKAHYPPGTKVITLTGVTHGGVWTQEEVVGHNYWRRKPTRAEAISLQQGDHVVLRLRSADNHHSFEIPDLGLGPVDIHGGYTVELEFDANQSGEFMFMCMTFCGVDHGDMFGNLVVREKTPAIRKSASRTVRLAPTMSSSWSKKLTSKR